MVNKIKYVYDKGYRVNEHGEVISPITGKPRKLWLKVGKRGDCYYTFGMQLNQTSFSIRVHRLAAYQKFGDELFEHEVVRHLDGDSKNNSFDNLALGSHSDNSFDVPKDDRIAKAKKGAAKVKKFTDDEIRFIRSTDQRACDLCKKYNVYKSTISEIRSKKIYKDVPDIAV